MNGENEWDVDFGTSRSNSEQSLPWSLSDLGPVACHSKFEESQSSCVVILKASA